MLIAGHKLNFIQPLISYFRANGVVNLKVQEWPGHQMGRIDKLIAQKHLSTVQVVFCEWCLSNAVWFSHNVGVNQRLFIRLHSQEMNLPYLTQLNWERVAGLIVIAPRNLRILKERFPEYAHKMHLLYNTFDTKAFDRPKTLDASFRIGMIGMVPWMKRPDRALEVLRELQKFDARYHLSFIGQDPRSIPWMRDRPQELALYADFWRQLQTPELCQIVTFDGPCSDVPKWLQRIGFVLSTSDYEGSHQAVAEGMASGAVPALLNWAGSSDLYPERFIQGSPIELAAMIHAINRHSWHADAEACRLAVQRFSTEVLGPHYADYLGLRTHVLRQSEPDFDLLRT